MYENNYLANSLRSKSVSREGQCFAELSDGSIVTYGMLFEQAEKMASVLVQSGLAPGDRVIVQVEKSIEFVELYIAVILAGGIFLPLNTAYTPNELDYFINDAKPSIFVCSPESANVLEAIALKSGVKKIYTLSGDCKGSLVDSVLSNKAEFISVDRGPDDIASILYTSGTTGRSKGAMLSHKNLVSNASTLKELWKFTEDDKLIHALPVFHIHGLFVAINITLSTGSSLLFHTGFNAQAILDDMSRASVLMGVPTFYVRLLGLDTLNEETTKSMRLFVSGSAPLLEETHIEWSSRTGHGILERYGMTETNMNTSNPYSGERIAGTVGFPLPGVEVIVADPSSGERLGINEIGSVEVKGPNVFSGYWNMPEKTKEEFRANGFFITGDIGKFDEKGYLSIVGRSKDMIISGGFNVYPKEIELLIDEMEGVDESAVIGLPHPDFGEGVAAVVVAKKAVSIDSEEIRKDLADKLSKFKQPKMVYVLDELPRNTMGKVQKVELRETYKNAFQ